MNRYISLLLTVILLATVSCQQDELVSGGTDETVTLTYSVGVDSDDAATRAIGDGQSIDQLLVGVFYEGNLVEIHTFDNRTTEGKFPISIPLLRGKQYTLAFWAHDKDNTAYTIDQSTMQVTVDYSKYGTSLLASKAFEAFSAFRQVTVSQNVTDGGNLSLTRPFAQVNVAAAEEDILNKVKRTELKLTNLPTTFNPLTDAVSGSETRTFIFTDFSVEDGDKLTPSESTDSYTYLATVWALPATSSITVNLYDAEEGGNTIREQLDFTGVVLNANHRVNIVGNMIQQQTMQAWNGVDFTDPTRADKELSCTVTLDNMTRADGQVLHIETSDELAYVLRYGVPTGYTSVHICNHLNMGSHDWKSLPKDGSLTPQNFPAGTLVSGIANDGTSVFTVSNITMNGNGATGLFGDTESLTVRDVAFDNIQIVNASATDGVGLLAGTATSNLTVQNVTVSNSSVSASAGKAGGLVGYISRKTYDDRSETLQADFTNCTLTSTSVSGSVAGKLVGELSGYDNGEVLNFDATCTATDVSVGTYASPYVEGNESCWLADNDYSAYNAFLGNETHCRGVVNYGANRFTQKWDGQRTVVPMLANATYDGNNVTAGTNKYVVYSPFDLAGVWKKTVSPSAIYLKADIDMYGQGADGKYNVPSNFTQSAYTSTDDNPFSPFNYVTTLDGYKSDSENFSIYNLCIEQLAQERAAFILYASGTTTHKNINFRNCQTVSTHKVVDTDAKAYGAILVSNVDANYKMENVHAYDCKVFALQKMGTLGARINGTSTLTNNSVNNCYVENYQCWISEEFSSGEISISVPVKVPFIGTKYFDVTAVAYKSFYPHGEVGGMYGFIQGNSTITGCEVNTMTVNAYGQDDVKAEYRVVKSDYNLISDGMVSTAMSALGLYLIPGRHVSTFIGDIRATGSIQLTGCIVDNSSTCTNRWDKHNDMYHYIGQGYYVKYLDSEGTITVDGKSLTVADCKTTTIR